MSTYAVTIGGDYMPRTTVVIDPPVLTTHKTEADAVREAKIRALQRQASTFVEVGDDGRFAVRGYEAAAPPEWSPFRPAIQTDADIRAAFGPSGDAAGYIRLDQHATDNVGLKIKPIADNLHPVMFDRGRTKVKTLPIIGDLHFSEASAAKQAAALAKERGSIVVVEPFNGAQVHGSGIVAPKTVRLREYTGPGVANKYLIARASLAEKSVFPKLQAFGPGGTQLKNIHLGARSVALGASAFLLFNGAVLGTTLLMVSRGDSSDNGAKSIDR